MSALALCRRLDDPRARRVVDLAERVRVHPVFAGLGDADGVRVFMSHHVFAVFDFMSLLKSIEAAIAPHGAPWTPPADAELARFVNELVLGEESDEFPGGGYASHFETYLRAMDAAGADARPIHRLVAALRDGIAWRDALAASDAPPAAAAFVASTFACAAGTIEERVASFTLGREEVIPGMFREAVARLQGQRPTHGADFGLFRWYLDRHVEVDGDHHGPLSARLFERVCLRDERARGLALAAAARALEARLALWDATRDAIAAARAR